MQGISGGAPYVTVKAGDADDLKAKIEAFQNTGTLVFVPPNSGDYDLGSDIIELTLTNEGFTHIIGSGKKGIIKGSAVSLLHLLNASFILGTNTPKLLLENLAFEHDAPANGIGLDLVFGDVNLSNIRIKNTNAIKTDKIGIRLGQPTAASSADNGGCSHWNDVSVGDYGIGYDIGYDHGIFDGCRASAIEQKAYSIHSYAKELCFRNPFLYGGAEANVILFYFDYCGRNIDIFNPKSENTVDFAVAHFQHNGVHFSQRPRIFGFDSTRASITLMDNEAYYYMSNVGGQYPTKAMLLNKSVNIAETAIAHGLSVTPTVVLPISRVATAVVAWSKAADATNIYLKAMADATAANIFVSKDEFM